MGPKSPTKTKILSGVFMKKKSKQTVVKPVNQKIVNVATPKPKERESRLPAVGAVITKKYHGQNLEVKVLENHKEKKKEQYIAEEKAAELKMFSELGVQRHFIRAKENEQENNS